MQNIVARKINLVPFSVQYSFVACFFIVTAIFFPVTPDELSRFTYAKNIISGVSYDYFWPPLTVYLLVANPFLEGGVLAGRILNIIITLPIFFYLLKKYDSDRSVLFWASIPYFALVVSTTSPQGLMIALLGWIVLQPNLGFFVKSLLIALTYSVNPSTIAIIPVAFAVLLFTRFRSLSDFGASIVGYLLVIPWVVAAKISTGHMLVTLSSNGPLNLFLGNNPNLLSHRGVGSITEQWKMWGLEGEPSYIQAVVEFFSRTPLDFIFNLLKKLFLYLMPFDHIKSGIGNEFNLITFAYIGFFQILLVYYLVKKIRVSGVDRSMALALAFYSMSWVLYTIFFVKLRFRIPFDFFLFVATVVCFSNLGFREPPSKIQN